VGFNSNFLDNVEDSDDAVAASAGEHVSRVAEVQREAGATQVLDLSAGLKHLLSIKHLNLVGTGATSNNQIACVLLELGLVDHAWLF